jgi:hypothetical protein
MKNYTNPYTQKLFLELQPLIGVIIAQSVLKKIAEKIGKTEESLSISDASEIVKGLEKSLAVFLGSDVASEAARRIGQMR